jgi:hypothetical protein
VSWVVGNGSVKFNVSRALFPDQQFKPTFFGQTWGEAHSSERGEELVMNTSYLSRFVLKSVLISCSNRVATTSRRTLSVGVSNPFSICAPQQDL